MRCVGLKFFEINFHSSLIQFKFNSFEIKYVVKSFTYSAFVKGDAVEKNARLLHSNIVKFTHTENKNKKTEAAHKSEETEPNSMHVKKKAKNSIMRHENGIEK